MRRASALLAVGASLLLPPLASGTGVHEVLSFDYGWRFHLGPVGSNPGPPGPPPAPPPPPAQCSADKLKEMFPVANNAQLKGLDHGTGKTAEACAASCCEVGESCFGWQFSNATKGGGCWIGSGTPFGGTPKEQWVGMRRAGPLPPPSPPAPPPHAGDGPDILPATSPAADPKFDDSKWELLDLPHDYIVEGAYSASVPSDQGHGRPAGGAGQSYLPRDLGFCELRPPLLLSRRDPSHPRLAGSDLAR